MVVKKRRGEQRIQKIREDSEKAYLVKKAAKARKLAARMARKQKKEQAIGSLGEGAGLTSKEIGLWILMNRKW